MSENPRYEVVLWGSRGTGKSTALAAALCDPAGVNWLDRRRSSQLLETLGSIYHDLQSNRIPNTTGGTQVLDAWSQTGSCIVFRDMRGEEADDPIEALKKDHLRALQAAAAVVAFLPI